MEKGAAQVYIFAAAIEQQGDDSVHDYTGGGGDHHEQRMHRHRLEQACGAFVKNVKRERYQENGIHKRSQNAGALISEGLG